MNRHLKNAAFGVIGGAAGTFLMGLATAALKKFQSTADKNLEKRLTPEPPTDALAERLAGKDKKEVMSQVIHWGYGIFWGGVYGVLRKEYPVIAKAFGLPFGFGLTLFGEALLLPATKLSAPAYQYPRSVLARDLAAHWVYSATSEAACRLLQSAERSLAESSGRTSTELRRVS